MKCKYSIFLIVFLLACFPIFSQEIILLSEEYPPFNYTVDGYPTGAATQIVEKMMEIAGYDYTLRFLPWARAYAMVQSEPNTLIFAIKRTPEREDKFLWVGYLFTDQCGVYALRSKNMQVDSFEDLKNYRLGTYRDDVIEEYFLSKGFARGGSGISNAPLQSVVGMQTTNDLFQQLLSGKIDFLPAYHSQVYFTAQRYGFFEPEETLEQVMPLPELSQQGIYVAANKESDPEMIERLQAAMKLFHSQSGYREILDNWHITYKEEPLP